MLSDAIICRIYPPHAFRRRIAAIAARLMGPASLDTPQSPVSFASFDWVGFALGIVILLGLEALRRWTARQAGLSINQFS